MAARETQDWREAGRFCRSKGSGFSQSFPEESKEAPQEVSYANSAASSSDADPQFNRFDYAAASPGKRTVNTDPLPGSLATVTSPPIMRASLRVMARPSPVPPKRCAVVLSAWLMRELVPGAARVALLVEPANVRIAEGTVRDAEAAARAMGLQMRVLNAKTSREIDTAFATLASERPDALFVGGSSFFYVRRVQLAHLATHHRVPATYSARQYVEAGGLMSYGASLTDASRQMGVYTGLILKGAKPADLPVMQSTKFELVINLHTAKMLGLTVPDKLLATADEVIE